MESTNSDCKSGCANRTCGSSSCDLVDFVLPQRAPDRQFFSLSVFRIAATLRNRSSSGWNDFVGQIGSTVRESRLRVLPRGEGRSTVLQRSRPTPRPSLRRRLNRRRLESDGLEGGTQNMADYSIFHDGSFDGLWLDGKSAHIFLATLEHESHVVVARGVVLLKADDVRQGNIIFDVVTRPAAERRWKSSRQHHRVRLRKSGVRSLTRSPVARPYLLFTGDFERTRLYSACIADSRFSGHFSPLSRTQNK